MISKATQHDWPYVALISATCFGRFSPSFLEMKCVCDMRGDTCNTCITTIFWKRDVWMRMNCKSSTLTLISCTKRVFIYRDE